MFEIRTAEVQISTQTYMLTVENGCNSGLDVVCGSFNKTLKCFFYRAIFFLQMSIISLSLHVVHESSGLICGWSFFSCLNVT